MAAPVVLSYSQGTSGGVTNEPTVVLTAGTVVPGNWIVVVNSSDWDPFFKGTSLLPPQDGQVWKLLADTFEASVNVPHVKVWARQATQAGVHTITMNKAEPSADNYVRVYVLDNLDTSGLFTWDYELRSGGFSSIPAESVNALTSGLLLINYVGEGSGLTYSGIPGGFTNRGEIDGFFSASLQLDQTVSAGPTGVQTVTVTPSINWYSSVVIVLQGQGDVVLPTPALIESSSRWGVLLTNADPSAHFDLPTSVGQRVATFAFELINGITGEIKGTLHPPRNQPPVLSHDTTRTIVRSISMVFTTEDTIEIDPLTDRVLPFLVMPDGTRYPLGRYMATAKTNIVVTQGTYANMQFVDEMFIIDQKLDEAFNTLESVPPSTTSMPIDLSIRRFLARFPQIMYRLEASNDRTAASWTIGTEGGSVLKALCDQGGYFSPWFDNDGELQMIQAFDPQDKVPTVDLDTNPRVFRNSITRQDDLLEAPNRFVVVSNSGAEETPRVGTYDVPASAPHSIQRRGIVIPEVFELPVESQTQATIVARSLGIQQTIFERVDLSTPVDPRHDSYDVIRWDGENWLELAWSMEMREGGTMRHTMRKVYRDLDVA